MSREIIAGDGLLVGDRCRVRPNLTGRIEETPTIARRTYMVRLDSGELLEREWMQIDRIVERLGGPRTEASMGKPIQWDAHPAPMCRGRKPCATDINRNRNGSST